jgi:hypothetical protein
MSEFFFKVGGTAWVLVVGLSLLALFAQLLSNFQLSDADWQLLWLYLGGGGLAAMVVGGVCAIWETK